ncbi:hypothetical protein KEJ18_01790 [Candidatus Bathyarchaeota archaeon]|nr:hypothetical protein [Candidatus Bathyarchaeota archaeon]
MADWRAVYENWDIIPEENKQLIKQLLKEKPKEKLAELFVREPYAKMVYEKVIGAWLPPIQHELKDPLVFPEFQRPTEKERQTETNFAKKVIQQGAQPESIGTHVRVFLPIMSLVFLLGAEVSYYNSGLTVFLDNILPLNLMTWKLLLSLALALDLATAVYLLKRVKKNVVLSKGPAISIIPKTNITASAFVPVFKKIRTKGDEESLKNGEER